MGFSFLSRTFFLSLSFFIVSFLSHRFFYYCNTLATIDRMRARVRGSFLLLIDDDDRWYYILIITEHWHDFFSSFLSFGSVRSFDRRILPLSYCRSYEAWLTNASCCVQARARSRARASGGRPTNRVSLRNDSFVFFLSSSYEYANTREGKNETR